MMDLMLSLSSQDQVGTYQLTWILPAEQRDIDFGSSSYRLSALFVFPLFNPADREMDLGGEAIQYVPL